MTEQRAADLLRELAVGGTVRLTNGRTGLRFSIHGKSVCNGLACGYRFRNEEPNATKRYPYGREHRMIGRSAMIDCLMHNEEV